MKHVLYARFSREEDAIAAAEALGTHQATRGCHVATHHAPLASSELGLTETSSRSWGTEGVVVGGALGALFGGVIFPALGVPIAAPEIAAAATGFAGCVYGGWLSTIVGATTPDRRLEELARHMSDGEVLMTVEAEGEAGEARAAQLLAERSVELSRHKLV